MNIRYKSQLHNIFLPTSVLMILCAAIAGSSNPPVSFKFGKYRFPYLVSISDFRTSFCMAVFNTPGSICSTCTCSSSSPRQSKKILAAALLLQYAAHVGIDLTAAPVDIFTICRSMLWIFAASGVFVWGGRLPQKP